MYKIKIGEGSCGISAGAGKIHKLLDEKNSGNYTVHSVGCIGMCFLEPIVDIYNGDALTARLVKVSPDDVDKIISFTEKALAEIRRVLKDDGVLIAPTFTHAGNSFSGKVRAFFMRMAGFPLRSKWTSAEYLRFLSQNGWAVRKSAVLKASFPLTYAECVKSEV